MAETNVLKDFDMNSTDKKQSRLARTPDRVEQNDLCDTLSGLFGNNKAARASVTFPRHSE
jgi:hypothetical protein